MPPNLYHRYIRIALARETGWTLDVIDGLGVQDMLDLLAVIQGLHDVMNFQG